MLTIIFVLVFLQVRGVTAQNPNDTINPGAFNRSLLSQMIRKGIDSVRISLGVTPLQYDTILSRAAYDHSDYLKNQRIISHGQPSAKKSSVQKRVEFFGGTGFLCGENIAASYVSVKMADRRGRIYYNHTYKELADEFIRLWVQSKDHYTNLQNPAYNHTGVGISLNVKSKRVVAVQVFAHKKNKE